MADLTELTPDERERHEQRAREIRQRRAKERKIRRGKRRWRAFMAVYSILFLLLPAATEAQPQPNDCPARSPLTRSGLH